MSQWIKVPSKQEASDLVTRSQTLSPPKFLTLMDQDRLDSIARLLEKIQAGEMDAKHQLFELVDAQLRNLTRKMLSSFSVVRRWEETDDVWQNASMRIWKSFEKMEFQSARHFLNTSALQIRRELLTRAEQYRRPNHEAARHATPPPIGDTEKDQQDWENPTDNLDVINSWTQLHASVEQLSEPLKEVFNLHWYHGLTHEAISQLLEVSTRTIKRRWQAARLELAKSVDFD